VSKQLGKKTVIPFQGGCSMIGKVTTCSRRGMMCSLVEVEIDLKRGLPRFTMVGSPAHEVREARDRVRSALLNSGYEFPLKRITVNLSPAETVKTGTHYDLAIAMALLAAVGDLPIDCSGYSFFGEVKLDGGVVWVRGLLPLVLKALDSGIKACFIPVENLGELAILGDPRIIAVESIQETVTSLLEGAGTSHTPGSFIRSDIIHPDYSVVNGQGEMVNAFVVAASGRHHMLVTGPPGSGKSLAAHCLPGILPPLTETEIIEVDTIHSIAAENRGQPRFAGRPVRDPHCSVSVRGMVGGGPAVLPGEVSLAHKGVLLLDEFSEFKRDTMQALRTVLDRRESFISMREGWASYPADFMLVATTNPCPCGYYGSQNELCFCSPGDIRAYSRKLHNPLIDRIDLQITVGRVSARAETNRDARLTSGELLKRVIATRNIQAERYRAESFACNASIPAEMINQYCFLDRGDDIWFREYCDDNLLSLRTYHAILRMARTVADLHSEVQICRENLCRAIDLRSITGLYSPIQV
jgi:magnesium chelatase family protein